jgi:hypothetical protein
MRKAIVAIFVVVLIPSCTRRTAVTMEQVHDTQSKSTVALYQRGFPPRCEEIPLPAYPDTEAEQRPERVSVRVEFTISKEGVPRNLRATSLSPSTWDELYIGASLNAVERIRCEPAWSPPRPDSDDFRSRPREYRSSVIFHFFRDEKQARIDHQH